MERSVNRWATLGRRSCSILLAALAISLLASCGGAGRDADSGSASPPASGNFSYPSPEVFVIGKAITAIAPNINGTLSGFAAASALPAGLTLDHNTGVISGTPTVASTPTQYVVTASAPEGIVHATIILSVVAPPVINYGPVSYTYTIGIPARTLNPGPAGNESGTSWSIRPALPNGLTLNAADGTISGSPTEASPATSYTVTAANLAGQTSSVLTIEVDSDVLAQLGHVNRLQTTRFSGAHLVSVDASDHWVLWDYASGKILADGDSDCLIKACGLGLIADVAGPTAVIRTGGGFEVYSAASGTLLATISAAADWWQLASDGSYISAGSRSSLFAWSPSGQLLFARQGNYSSFNIFAGPGAIRVAAGPAGSVIESVTVPSGGSSISPQYNGQFSSWFLDGSRFLTLAGTTAVVYSTDALQQAAVALGSPPQLVAGQGNWFWTFSDTTLNVYAVGSSTTPAASYQFDDTSAAFPSGLDIGVAEYGKRQFSVIDLSGATPSKSDFQLPVPYAAASSFAATSASQWVVGNDAGVLFDGASAPSAPRFLALGAVTSIAGSTDRVAVATAAGLILYFNASTLMQEGSISYASSKLAISTDGTILAALGDTENAQYAADWSIKAYSLPAGTLLFTWPYSVGGNVFPQNMDLSASGAVLGQVLFTPVPSGVPFYTLESGPTTGGALTFSTTFQSLELMTDPPPAVRLSPDGSIIAYSSNGANLGTNIFQNGSIITAVSGWLLGWIDNNRLLVGSYSRRVGQAADGWCQIVGISGQSTGSCALPVVTQFQPLTGDTLYTADLNEIVTLSTGAINWSSADSTPLAGQVGAVAGTRAIFVAGTEVVAQSVH